MNSLSTIRAVTFDVGGTLIEPWPSVGHVYSLVAAECGAGNFPPDLLTERFIDAWNAKSSFDYSIGAWRKLVDAIFDGLVPAPRVETLFPVLYRRFERPEAWRVFEDVIPTLRELRGAGLKLGIISNWDERLRPLLAGLRLAGYFDIMEISHKAGCTKPAREIFLLAAGQFELPPSAILHVGDSFAEDVEGALSAGMASRLLRRDRNSAEPGSICDLRQAIAATK